MLVTPTLGELRAIPSGKAGVIETLRLMRRLVRESKKLLPIRTLAMGIVADLDQKAWTGEVSALHSFVRDSIRYIRDVRGVETLQTPVKTLELRQGDCDDKAVLLASLLESIGHPSRFVAIGFRPEDFEHVYVETRIADRWIPLETTEPVEVGWTPQHIAAKLVIHN